MTIPSFSDILLGSDILEKANLRPFWEAIKVYSIRVLLITSSIITIIGILLKPIRCSGYQSGNITFSTSDMQYVGNICAQKLEIQYKFSGVLAISMSILLYILSNWWKLIPTVRSGFLAVHNVNRKLGEQNLSWIEIKNLLTKPKDQDQVQEQAGDQSNESTRLVAKKNDRRVAYDCCRILFLRKGWVWVPVYYCISCFSSLLGSVASVTLMAVFWLKEDLQQNITFKCDIPEADTSHKTGEFLCSNDLIKTLTPYMWISSLIHVILFIANLISICVSIYSCCLRATHATDAIYSLKLYKDHAFIKVFSNWSQRLYEQTTWLMSNQYIIIKKMEENCGKAIALWDQEYLSLYMCMHKKNAKLTLQSLETSSGSLTRDNIKNFTLLFKLSVWCNEITMFKSLHEKLIETKNDTNPWSCECEVLKLTLKEATSFLEVIRLREEEINSLSWKKLIPIEHILSWIRDAHKGLVTELEIGYIRGRLRQVQAPSQSNGSASDNNETANAPPGNEDGSPSTNNGTANTPPRNEGDGSPSINNRTANTLPENEDGLASSNNGTTNTTPGNEDGSATVNNEITNVSAGNENASALESNETTNMSVLNESVLAPSNNGTSAMQLRNNSGSASDNNRTPTTPLRNDGGSASGNITTPTMPPRNDGGLSSGTYRTSTTPPWNQSDSAPGYRRTPTMPQRNQNDSASEYNRASTTPPRNQIDSAPEYRRTPTMPPRNESDSASGYNRAPTTPPRNQRDSAQRYRRTPTMPPRYDNDSALGHHRTSSMPATNESDATSEYSRTPSVPEMNESDLALGYNRTQTPAKTENKFEIKHVESMIVNKYA